MFSQNKNNYQSTEEPNNDNHDQFEETSKFKNDENSNYNYDDSGSKIQNEILDKGEREAYDSKNDEHHEEDEEQMDYENNHYYQENAYKNLQKNQDYNPKNEYEVVNVEHQGETEDDQKYYHSDENMEKTPQKNEKKAEGFVSNNFNESKNVNLVQNKEDDQKMQSNQVQPNDINFFKLKNSKLFQKFLKEEGQIQKKPGNNNVSPIPEEQTNNSQQMNDFSRKNKANYESQKNFKIEENKIDEIRRITPMKHLQDKNKDEKYLSRKSNNNEDDKELIAYSQYVPGNVYQTADVMRNNFMPGMPYDYNMNPQMIVYNNDQMFRNQNPIINDFAQKNYYASNNSVNLDIYINKINELNEILTKEMNQNQILEKKCNDYLVHIEQLTSNYEELKRKVFQNTGPQREFSKYEEKINLLNQNLMENEKKIEEMLDDNENLKRKLNQEINLKMRFEDDKKQLNNYVEQLKMDAQEKENMASKRSDDNVLLKKSVDNLKNDLFQMKAAKEKMEEKAKDLEIQSLNLNNDLDFEKKKFLDAKERNKNLEFENEKSRNELNLLRTQINNLLLENENSKNELYNQKSFLQDKNQKELQITVMLEKANMEVNQFKSLLARTEKNLSDQREINQNLIKKISEIAKEKTIFERTSIKNSPIPGRNSNEQMTPPESFVNNQRNMSSEKNLLIEQQEYYLPPSKWSQTKIQQERYPSTDIALQSNQTVNKSAFVTSNNNREINNVRMNNANMNYQNPPVRVVQNSNLNNSSIRTKNYGNILEWQENNNNNQISTSNQRRQLNLQNYESNAKAPRTIPDTREKYETNVKPKQVIPESREKYGKTSEQEYENTMNTIKNIEKNLMLAQIQKEKLEHDFRKIEESKTKSAANIRRKAEIDDELRILSANISHLKNKLREMNALHFY